MEKVRPLRLRITRRAYKHLSDIEAYIAKDNPRAALRVGTRLRSSFDLLCQFPDVGRRSKDSRYFEWVVPGLPYLIVYRTDSDFLDILGVFHGKQDRRST